MTFEEWWDKYNGFGGLGVGLGDAGAAVIRAAEMAAHDAAKAAWEQATKEAAK